MTDSNDSRTGGNVHPIVPTTQAAPTETHSIEDVTIAADELDNLIYALLMLLSENTTHSQEQRAAITITGAMQQHTATLKQYCAQK